MGLSIGRRKVLLAKLKAARDGVGGGGGDWTGGATPTVSGRSGAASGRGGGTSGRGGAKRETYDDDDDDDDVALFSVPTPIPAYGSAVAGKKPKPMGLSLSLGGKGDGTSSTIGRLPSMDALPTADDNRDTMHRQNANLRKKKSEVREAKERERERDTLSNRIATNRAATSSLSDGPAGEGSG